MGNGTIYDNGSLNGGGNFSGSERLRPPGDPQSPRMAARAHGTPRRRSSRCRYRDLELVFINPKNVSTPVNLQGSGHEWQVTVFVVKGFTSNGGTAILGPVLADGGSMAGNPGSTFPPIRPSAHRQRSSAR